MKSKRFKDKIKPTTHPRDEIMGDLLHDVPVPMWLYDPVTLYFLDVNRAAIERYGYSRKEFLKMTVADICPKGTVGPARDSAKRTTTERPRRSHHKAKDGGIISVKVTSRRLHIGVRDVILSVVTETPVRGKAASPATDDGSLDRYLFEQSPTPMLIYSEKDLKILAVNEAFLVNSGYTREEAAGLLLTDLYEENDRKAVTELVRKLKGGVFKGETRNVRKDGTVATVESYSHSITYEGQAARAVVIHDISEQKLIEKMLRDSERRLSRAESVAHMGFLDWDLKTNRIYLSDEARRIHGIDVQEGLVTPDLVARVVHPDDFDRVNSNLERAATDTKPYDIDHRIIWSDGTVRWVHAQAQLLKNAEGEPERLLGTVVDITDRKFAEEALRQSEERYRSLFENNLAGVFQTSADGMVLDCNDAFAQLFGLRSKDDIKGRLAKEFYPSPADRRKYLRLLVEQGQLRNFEYLRRRDDGTLFWTMENVRLVRSPDGTPLRLEGTIIDISERKKAERELQESRERYRRLFDDHTAMKFIIDPETGAVLDVNESTVRFYGWSREEFKRMTIRDINVIEAEELQTAFEKAVSNSQDRFELRHRLADGSTRDVEVFTSKIETQGKAILESIVHDITERKEAEEAMIESERRYRRLITFLSDPVYIHVDGRISFANDAMCRLLGAADPSELIGRSIFEIIHPDSHEIVKQRLPLVFGGQLAPIIEEKFVRLDGTSVDVEVSAVAIEWQGATGVQVMARDISARKEAEERLRVSDEIIKRVNSLILIADADGQIIYASPSVKSILGFEPEEVMGDGWWRLTQWDDSQEFRNIAAAARGEIPVAELPYESRVRSKDGKSHWILWQDAKGIDRELIGVGQDITDRKRAEEALVTSERKYKDIFESAPLGVYQSTFEGRFITCNSELAKMLGYGSPEEMIGLDMGTDVYFDEGERNALIAKYELRGFIADLEIRWKKKDGSLVWIQLNSRAIKDAAGKTLRFEGFVRDVSEQKRAKEQLRQTETRRRELELELIQAQKLEGLGTLASGIAHDFNNLLGVIIGHASLLDRAFVDGQVGYKKNVDAILKASTRGAGLVRQMLTFARKTDVMIESVPLNDLVGEIVRFIRETFSKTISVETHLAPALPSIDADATQVHQILLNLCVNARDAMPDGGTLTISTGKEDRREWLIRHPKATAAAYVVLTVADTGLGMNEETQRRIFEPFFTTKEFGKGTGLGLSLVFGIMESHNGFITLRSQPGQGTTFRCYFPLPDRAAELRAIREADLENIPGGNETILVVEDEEMLRELLSAILEPKGYELLLAEDGERGLAIYRENRDRIQLVLSDLGLPKFGGEELFARLKEVNPDIRFILSSGYMEPGTKVELLTKGVREILPKPYNPNEVLLSIRRALDG